MHFVQGGGWVGVVGGGGGGGDELTVSWENSNYQYHDGHIDEKSSSY